MNRKFQPEKITASLLPFLIMGTAIALFLGLLFMFSYVLIWGLVIGGILWLATTVKHYLFPGNVTKTEVAKKNQGRIIEHDDKK